MKIHDNLINDLYNKHYQSLQKQHTEITISIIITSIRPENWIRIVQSLASATQESIELIFVGPYGPISELEGLINIHYYIDFGSPNRCQQIGATLASGKYIIWLADDIILEPTVLQNAINILKESDNHKRVVVTKYTEGKRNNPTMLQDNYYYMGNALPNTPYIINDWWIFNIAIMHRIYFNYLGGFDCKLFETACIAHNDLGIRVQRDDSEVIMLNESLGHVDRFITDADDYGPIQISQLYDTFVFQKIYSDPNCIHRIQIKLDNWKRSSPVWERRFLKCFSTE